MEKLVIIGSGEYSQQVVDYALSTKKFQIIGFIDNNRSKGEVIIGYPVLGGDDCIGELYKTGVFDSIFIALGYLNLHTKEKLYNYLKDANIPLAQIISPMAIVHPTAKIGEGCLITEGVIVMKNVVIKDDVYIGSGSSIGHDSIIGEHSFVAGRVAMAGFVNIGKRNFIGVNSSVANNIKVCDDVWISLGAIIAKNLKLPGKYFASSLKLIKL